MHIYFIRSNVILHNGRGNSFWKRLNFVWGNCSSECFNIVLFQRFEFKIEKLNYVRMNGQLKWLDFDVDILVFCLWIIEWNECENRCLALLFEKLITSEIAIFTWISTIPWTETITVPIIIPVWIICYLTRKFTRRRFVQTLFWWRCWRSSALCTKLLSFCIVIRIRLERDWCMTLVCILWKYWNWFKRLMFKIDWLFLQWFSLGALTLLFFVIHDNCITERKIGGLWNRSRINVLMFDVVFSAINLIWYSLTVASSSPFFGALPLTASCNFFMYLHKWE